MSDPDWDMATIDARMAAGCHHSAQDHCEFIRKEMAEFMEEGFFTVIPYQIARSLPGLRLPPLGVQEEHTRRPRLVVDHTWFGVKDGQFPHTYKQAADKLWAFALIVGIYSGQASAIVAALRTSLNLVVRFWWFKLQNFQGGAKKLIPVLKSA